MFSPDHLNFPYPLFATSLHMLVQFTLASTILFFFPSLRPRATPPQPDSPTTSSGESSSSKPIMTKLFYITRLIPCGSATSLDIGLGNMSLKFITLTFLTMCKSSALIFVLLFAFLFRLETISFKLIIVIAAMTLGVVMMVAAEADFNAIGFGLVIASAFFSGFRWGLTQILLLRHPATANPFSTLFFLTPIMFVTLILISLGVEGPANIFEGFKSLAHDGALKGVMILVFPGSLAFCMIASEFALLQRSSVVTLSICGIFKEVVTIGAGGIVYHDQLTPINISGLLVTIASIASYNYMKITKMRREARMDVADTNNQSDTESDDDVTTATSPAVPDSAGRRSRPPSRLITSFGTSSGNVEGSKYQSLAQDSYFSNPNTAATGPYGLDDGGLVEESIPVTPTDERGRASVRARLNGGATSGLAVNASPYRQRSSHGNGRRSPIPRAATTPIGRIAMAQQQQQPPSAAGVASELRSAEYTGPSSSSRTERSPQLPASMPSRNNRKGGQ